MVAQWRKSRTLMRSPVVKRQLLPRSGFFPFFSAVVQAERRAPLATCSVCISVYGCTNVAAPNPYRGSVAIKMAIAEQSRGSARRPRNISVPAYRPIQRHGYTAWACTSEGQVRGRGSTHHPRATRAAYKRAGVGVQSKAKGPGTRAYVLLGVQ
jgi:hypothetical protein